MRSGRSLAALHPFAGTAPRSTANAGGGSRSAETRLGHAPSVAEVIFDGARIP
jgi:hypothetical protein